MPGKPCDSAVAMHVVHRSDTGAAAWQFKQALTLLWHLGQGRDSLLYEHIKMLPGMARGVSTPPVGKLLLVHLVHLLVPLHLMLLLQDHSRCICLLLSIQHHMLPHMPAPNGVMTGPVPHPAGMLLPDDLVQELQYAPLIEDVQNHK